MLSNYGSVIGTKNVIDFTFWSGFQLKILIQLKVFNLKFLSGKEKLPTDSNFSQTVIFLKRCQS